MKFILKAAFALLVSSQAYADTVLMNQAQMNEKIQKLRAEVAAQCAVGEVQNVLSSLIPKECPKSDTAGIKKNFCNAKKDLILFLEGVMGTTNIIDVTKSFKGEIPPPDSLGGVLLYQMKNSIEQVNSRWAQNLMFVSSTCRGYSLKKELKKYTNPLHDDLMQTILFVNPPVVRIGEK